MSTETDTQSDELTSGNADVTAYATAMAMGNSYVTSAHAMGVAFANAVHAQNNHSIQSLAKTEKEAGAILKQSNMLDAIIMVNQVTDEKTTWP
ncbi:RebB family R body protein [Allorhizobium sp. BGMRC 0089]|uniref:RebB family R body protein n=1 Tax=Allorhizobium sonneratiae TaxID=2934936 RepID=UPI0020345D0E|nr:RebB family R body protein [Allorhizobium sonneratiae]MCM2290797.1 RebB family R body protein [Allorhizobium sonneratiae]